MSSRSDRLRFAWQWRHGFDFRIHTYKQPFFANPLKIYGLRRDTSRLDVQRCKYRFRSPWPEFFTLVSCLYSVLHRGLPFWRKASVIGWSTGLMRQSDTCLMAQIWLKSSQWVHKPVGFTLIHLHYTTWVGTENMASDNRTLRTCNSVASNKSSMFSIENILNIPNEEPQEGRKMDILPATHGLNSTFPLVVPPLLPQPLRPSMLEYNMMFPHLHLQSPTFEDIFIAHPYPALALNMGYPRQGIPIPGK